MTYLVLVLSNTYICYGGVYIFILWYTFTLAVSLNFLVKFLYQMKENVIKTVPPNMSLCFYYQDNMTVN